MPDIEPRIWLLPNGNVCKLIDGQYRHWDGGVGIDWPSNGNIVDRIGYYDELPEGAAPLVQEGVTPESLEAHADWLEEHWTSFKGLSCSDADDVRRAARHLRDELDATKAVEAARRKVLQDLKPGAYAVLRAQYEHVWKSKMSPGYVTTDGRLMVCRHGSREPEDCTNAYPAEGWTYQLLAEGDLSPVVGE